MIDDLNLTRVNMNSDIFRSSSLYELEIFSMEKKKIFFKREVEVQVFFQPLVSSICFF
jgi:hypothetical protein